MVVIRPVTLLLAGAGDCEGLAVAVGATVPPGGGETAADGALRVCVVRALLCVPVSVTRVALVAATAQTATAVRAAATPGLARILLHAAIWPSR